MSIDIGIIEIEEYFDKDGDLEINMRDETYYLTRSQVEDLRDHLTKILTESKRG